MKMKILFVGRDTADTKALKLVAQQLRQDYANLVEIRHIAVALPALKQLQGERNVFRLSQISNVQSRLGNRPTDLGGSQGHSISLSDGDPSAIIKHFKPDLVLSGVASEPQMQIMNTATNQNIPVIAYDDCLFRSKTPRKLKELESDGLWVANQQVLNAYKKNGVKGTSLDLYGHPVSEDEQKKFQGIQEDEKQIEKYRSVLKIDSKLKKENIICYIGGYEAPNSDDYYQSVKVFVDLMKKLPDQFAIIALHPGSENGETEKAVLQATGNPRNIMIAPRKKINSIQCCAIAGSIVTECSTMGSQFARWGYPVLFLNPYNTYFPEVVKQGLAFRAYDSKTAVKIVKKFTQRKQSVDMNTVVTQNAATNMACSLVSLVMANRHDDIEQGARKMAKMGSRDLSYLWQHNLERSGVKASSAQFNQSPASGTRSKTSYGKVRQQRRSKGLRFKPY